MRGGGVGPCLRPANQTQEEPGQAVLEQGQQHPDIVALGQWGADCQGEGAEGGSAQQYILRVTGAGKVT